MTASGTCESLHACADREARQNVGPERAVAQSAFANDDDDLRYTSFRDFD